jgi:GNAT superfamily N-acetyltransferase
MTVRIIDYTPALLPHFERISKHWISKYFTLEPDDIHMLEHAHEYLIDAGGHILFAAIEDNVVGTVALKKLEDNTTELTKMGVDEAYQGLKIGRLLAEAAIQLAWDQGFEKIILYSNTKLHNALNMYQKLGFREIPVEAGRYERSTVKMELLREDPNPHYAAAEELIRTINEWQPYLQKVNDSDAANRPARGKWSAKEILGHLIDSAINNNVRFIRAQQISLLQIPAYEQELWVRGQAWQYNDWQETIITWATFNRHLGLTIRTIPTGALAHQISISERAPVTLQYVIDDYVVHLKHHLQQIKSLLEAN